jgi:ribosome biogenesis protein ERB1
MCLYVHWQPKGDYFVSVSPNAGSAAVLINQLSKGNSQQPFSKTKGEAQLACFHQNKPFLFVASQQHARVYHLVKQTMVKRLSSGCRWISPLDYHRWTFSNSLCLHGGGTVFARLYFRAAYQRK